MNMSHLQAPLDSAPSVSQRADEIGDGLLDSLETARCDRLAVTAVIEARLSKCGMDERTIQRITRRADPLSRLASTPPASFGQAPRLPRQAQLNGLEVAAGLAALAILAACVVYTIARLVL
jgi:hypothetical protein